MLESIFDDVCPTEKKAVENVLQVIARILLRPFSNDFQCAQRIRRLHLSNRKIPNHCFGSTEDNLLEGKVDLHQ